MSAAQQNPPSAPEIRQQPYFPTWPRASSAFPEFWGAIS